MHVSEAILSRMMRRAFLPTPVPRLVIEDILERAARAPSGGKLQPWKIWVLSGEPLAREVGLHTAPIGAWSMWRRTLRERLRMPDELMLYCAAWESVTQTPRRP